MDRGFFSSLPTHLCIAPLICFFPQNRRACASAKVKYYFECCPEMCDQLGAQGHSLYFSADLRQCKCEVVGQKVTCADYTVRERPCQVFFVTASN